MEDVFGYDRFKDCYGKEDVDTIIDQAFKVMKEVVAPTAEEEISVYVKDGQAVIPESYVGLYKYMQENGWGTSNVDEENEAALPWAMLTAVNEMMNAANPAFHMYVVLTTGAAGIIKDFCDEHVKNMFLPKMYDGTWSGTMCLTESTAGSDVGDLLSKAYPTDDPRIYKIKGSKIFITSGDGQHVSNLVHMWLARIEGAAPGTKGISLFVVPKYWVNEDGSLEPNFVETVGVEHKLGLKGSATCALAAGDSGTTRGWLVGTYDAATGAGYGMSQMFQMMNEERMNTGVWALSVTANAYWNAVAYAKDRIQGRIAGTRTNIINHEDVKRMLLLNKATTEACRAIIYKACYLNDVARMDPDTAKRKWAVDRIDCLTPLAKAYTSDEAWSLINESIQVYGGYGFIEEYPAAQSARDCKIYSLWEGTNFIQSQDLVGRKWNMGKGAAFAAFLKDIEDFIAANKGTAGFEKEFANLDNALASYREIQAVMAQHREAGKAGLLPTFARRILTATGQLYGGFLLLDQALIARKRVDELGAGHYEAKFYNGKILSARYYLGNVVPNVWAVLDLVKGGDTSVIDADPEIFEY
jgi:alkylation response protein AidB-like acyl-CoA dehydrogenase